ncbi:MAG: AAA family ATPase [Desulfobacterales bacterium]
MFLDYKNCPSSSFCLIPAHEFLSIQEGFISAYQKRELPYDLTCYDLSLALNALPLRRENLTDVQEVLDYLERMITGQNAEQKEFLTQENGRFYFHLPEGRMDVHIVAEGYRKIALLYYLLRNGSLTKDSILFWDEPETNLNPKLIVQLVDVLKRLAALGMQIFIATHDYLLSYELSLLAEYPTEPNVDINFFALHKPERTAGVEVESGRTLAEIENNPILEEFAAHYDRESALFLHREKKGQNDAAD